METFSIKIISKNSKNILICTQYRRPSSKGKIFEEYLKKNFSKTKTRNKPIYIVGNLNINPLDHKVNANLKTYM